MALACPALYINCECFALSLNSLLPSIEIFQLSGLSLLHPCHDSSFSSTVSRYPFCASAYYYLVARPTLFLIVSRIPFCRDQEVFRCAAVVPLHFFITAKNAFVLSTCPFIAAFDQISTTFALSS